MPPDNFDGIIRLVSDLNLMKSIPVPVVSLTHISAIEIVLGIVVMAEIVGGIDEGASHGFI